jgi:plastocyanin
MRHWRILAAVGLLAVAVASPVFAQGPRNPVMYILMGDNYFLPASVTVQPRTTVVWINAGSTTHGVRSGLWDSGPMYPGQAFWRTFDVPGEYWFTDDFYTDQGMSGYVVVQYGRPVATRTPLPVLPPRPPGGGGGGGGEE